MPGPRAQPLGRLEAERPGGDRPSGGVARRLWRFDCRPAATTQAARNAEISSADGGISVETAARFLLGTLYEPARKAHVLTSADVTTWSPFQFHGQRPG